MSAPTHLDLCSGIAGFALAAGWNGYATIGFCEIDPWCQRVIRAHYPGIPIHDDLRSLTGDAVRGWLGTHEYRADDARNADGGNGSEIKAICEQIARPGGVDRPFPDRLDILTAGYPCQPFSHAGKRLGAEDDRHLWPEIARLVADIRPRWCLFENVAGHVSMGLDDVLADLEALGYAWGAAIVPACAVGAPHRRDRVWVVAHAERERVSDDGCGCSIGAAGSVQGNEPERERIRADARQRDHAGGTRSLANPAHGGPRRGGGEPPGPWQPGLFALGGEAVSDADEGGWRATERDVRAWESDADRCRDVRDANGQHRRLVGAGDAAPLGNREARDAGSRGAIQTDDDGQTLGSLGFANAGLPGRVARHFGFLDPRWGGDPRNAFGPDWEDGVARVTDHEPDRVNKLKALGNAIVPQVAFEIIRVMTAEAVQP